MDLTGKQVVFIAPKTFGYEVQITEALKKLGATVYFHSDKPNESKWFKAFLRLMPKFVWFYCDYVFSRWLNTTAVKNCDVVFIIKGEGVSIRFLKLLRAKHPNAKFILYMWDSLRNVKYTESKLKCFDKTMSFDPRDCANYPSLQYRSLFYLETYQNKPIAETYNKLFFLGTLNGDRPKVLAEIIQQLDRSIQFNYQLFVRSRVELFFRRFLDKSFETINKENLIFDAINPEVIQKSMSTCTAVLDIEHPNQSGLTMRTFEVLATGKKLITTNQSIVKQSFFDASTILVIDRYQPNIPLSFFEEKARPLPQSFYTENSIVGWLEDILDFSNTKIAQNNLK